MASMARERQIGTVYVPAEDAAEAALVDGLRVIPVESPASMVSHFRDEAPIDPIVHRDGWEAEIPAEEARDMIHVRG